MSLRGKTILITRQREQSDELIAAIEKRGGRAVVIPMIRITDPPSWHECDKALARLDAYHALVFTSANGAGKFFERLRHKGVVLSLSKSVDVFAVGEKTKKEIEKYGASVSFVPNAFSMDSLLEYFQKTVIRGRRFLLLKGSLGKDELEKELVKLGAEVDAVEVYRNDPPDDSCLQELRERFLKSEFDVVAFASPSAVRNFADAVPPTMFHRIHGKTSVCVIGPTTRASTLSLKFPVDIEADESTSVGLVEAINEYYSRTDNHAPKTGTS